MKNSFLFIFLFLFLILHFASFSQDHAPAKLPPYSGSGKEWVDSVFATLSQEERITQLIFVATFSNQGIPHEVEISDLIREHKVGGLIFFSGTAVKQAELTNFYQSQSRVPLLIVMDGEWGLGMRITDVLDFPYQMSLGAIQNDSLIYEMGSTIASHFKRLGVHINLAPVVDINNNPENPVINFRSFGENKNNVTRKAEMFMMGLQNHGILAVAKHFPGHGDTNKDSHLVLPVLNHSRERLDTMELYPYKQLIHEGLGGIMTGHLSIPVLDSTKDLASSLSKPVVTGLLRQGLEFQGLILTDALNMKAVTNYFSAGISDAMALYAGNDVLEYTEDVEKAIIEIKKAVDEGRIKQEVIDERCRKVLTIKYWAGLQDDHEIDTVDLLRDLNTIPAKLLNRELIKASITVLKNKQEVIPVQNLENAKIATLAVGSSMLTPFQEMLGKYTRMKHFQIGMKDDPEQVQSTLENLDDYDLVIVGITGLDERRYNQYGLGKEIESIVKHLLPDKPTIVTLFGNPYALKYLEGIEESDGLIITYQDSPLIQELTAQFIFGGFGASGRLPVSVNNKFSEGDGLNTVGGIRFQYSLPESVDIDSDLLEEKIDSIANRGLAVQAYPGCQVLVARKGVVVFHKTYGYHTYDNLIPVKKNDSYDFASVTKITGPLPALMKLHDEKKFSLDDKFARIWPDFARGDKSELVIREVLAHQSKLMPYIFYWTNTVKKNGEFKWSTFRKDSTARYNVKVDNDFFLHKNYREKIYRAIRKSPLREKNEYLYSGLSFVLYPKIIEELTGRDYETYLKETFYRPLGAYTITYNPTREFPVNRIIPTENDDFFRRRQIHGYVHDEAAAVMGGVSGNAGLFASINDLAKLMQMYLWMGTYGGKRYISEETMKTFTTYQFPENNNRRGLGFDKPNVGNPELPVEEQYPAAGASSESFGHSGYTGTFTWVDPKYNLLYIFFSNRVYPTRNNQKLYELHIRTSIQQVIYDAITDTTNNNNKP